MSEVTQIRPDRPETKPTNGGGGNGGSVVNHRLGDLERRMGVIEEDLKQLTKLCT